MGSIAAIEAASGPAPQEADNLRGDAPAPRGDRRPISPRVIARLRSRLAEIERQFAIVKRQIEEQRRVPGHPQH